jgi:type IV secretion system protein VirD4
VVPTLLSWGESAVITDLKGELWALTAGWRRQHAKNRVLRFEPAAANGSVCWNPLDEIRIGTEHEVGDVQNLATLIVDPDGRGLESHWQKTSQALLVGVILHALYKAANEGTAATLPAVDALLADPDRDVAELWMEMRTYGHLDGQNHPAVGSAARDMMDRPDEEAGSVLSTAKSYLAVYRDPVVARNVSKSEFRIRDLMHHEQPVSLYILTQPNDKTRLRPLVRVMVSMIVHLLADKLHFENGRPGRALPAPPADDARRVPQPGQTRNPAGVAGLRRRLRDQVLPGLPGHQPAQEPRNRLRPRRKHHLELPRAERLPAEPGRDRRAPFQADRANHRRQGTDHHQRPARERLAGAGVAHHPGGAAPLLTPDECLRMPGPIKNASGDIDEAGDMVVYVAGYPAIYGKQPLYFKDPMFQARAAIPAPKDSDKLIDVHDVPAGEGITL